MTPETETLSASEQAYFDSRGATEIKETAPAPEPEEILADDDGAPEAEIETEADDAAEVEIEAEGKPTGQSKVPLAALTKTRQEAKDERNKRIEAEKRAAVLEDRWNRVLEAQQQAEQPQVVAESIPDPDADPMGALAWATKQIKDQQEQQDAAAREAQQRQREDAEWNTVYTAVNNDFVAAVETDPTINEARDALIASYGMEFMAMGLTQQEAQNEINRIEREHIRYAHAKGLKIGDYVKALAKARRWEPKPVEAAGDKIDALNEAIEGSTSFGGTSGGAPRVLNAQSIADMKPDEFEAWLSKPGSAAKFRKLAGG